MLNAGRRVQSSGYRAESCGWCRDRASRIANWELLVSGPLLTIVRIPGPTCMSSKLCDTERA